MSEKTPLSIALLRPLQSLVHKWSMTITKADLKRNLNEAVYYSEVPGVLSIAP